MRNELRGRKAGALQAKGPALVKHRACARRDQFFGIRILLIFESSAE